jgi:hypothetical protein
MMLKRDFVHCKGDPTFPLAYAAIAVTDIQRLNTVPKRRLSCPRAPTIHCNALYF